jgi:hypothetical protein
MTPKENENWKTYDEIEKIYEDMAKIVEPLLKSKDLLDKTQLKTLQDFIILSLTSGYWITPRRSEDWCKMKINGYDKEKDNYIDFDKKVFVFNIYKTSKTYDEQEVEIPNKLRRMLKRYIKLLGNNGSTPGMFYLWNGNIIKSYEGIEKNKFNAEEMIKAIESNQIH